MTAAVGGLSSNVALEEAHNVTAGAGGGRRVAPPPPNLDDTCAAKALLLEEQVRPALPFPHVTQRQATPHRVFPRRGPSHSRGALQAGFKRPCGCFWPRTALPPGAAVVEVPY